MANDHARDELAQLRTLVECQQARLNRLERPRRRFPRRFLPLALVALLVVLTPLGLLAANPFNDLTGGVHDPNIDAIYNAGITTGCVPNVSYCPTDNVTRQEMASFLARTAGLGANKPVANAARLASSPATVGGKTYAANELTRVTRAAGAGTNLALSATFVEVASLALTYPGNGLVVVTGAGTVTYPGGGATVEFRLHDTTVAGGGISPVQIVTIPTVGGGSSYGSAAPTWLFNSGAAGPKTYALEARVTSGSALAVRTSSSMTAIFSPFGPDGAAQALER